MEEACKGSRGWTGREQLKDAGVGNGQLSSETDPGWHLQDSGAGGCKGQAGGRLSRPCTPSWEMRTVFCRQDGIRWATDNVGGREGRALGSVIRRVIVDVCPLMLASGRSASHMTSFSPQSSPVGVCLSLMFQGLSCGPEACETIPKVTRPEEVELACRPRGRTGPAPPQPGSSLIPTLPV